MATNSDMVRLFKAELEPCNVTLDETVAVLSEGDEKRNYADAFLAAAEELDAKGEPTTAMSYFPPDRIWNGLARTTRPAISIFRSGDVR